MTREQLEKILNSSIKKLLSEDNILIENDVSERAITHKLAEYIQLFVNDETTSIKYNVDCEYNRNFEEGQNVPKRLSILNQDRINLLGKQADKRLVESEPDDYSMVSVYPDIIVHKRGNNASNILVVEVKKNKRGDSIEFDKQKLIAFTSKDGTNNYRFDYGLLLMINTGTDKSVKPKLKWFINGSEE